MLSSKISISRYLQLENIENRKAIGDFVIQRFEERYFSPIENTPLKHKHGFTILAIACLVIETLESFYQGRPDTIRLSKKMFRDFFNRSTNLVDFIKDGDWFFDEIRCGILHQAETRGGWRIWRKGPLLDKNKKTINATKFLNEIRLEVRRYAEEIQSNDVCWNNLKKKMEAICQNGMIVKDVKL